MNLTPRTKFVNDVVAKLPNINVTVNKEFKEGKADPASPQLKRKRKSPPSKSPVSKLVHGSPPSKVSHHGGSPDIRRKILVKTVQEKLAKVPMMKEVTRDTTIDIVDTSVEDDSVSLEEHADKSIMVEADLSVVETFGASSKDLGDNSGIELSSTSSKPTAKVSEIADDGSIKESAFQTSASVSSSTPQKPHSTAATVQMKWKSVERSKRKVRIYFIESHGDSEAFKVVHRAAENTTIPVCINGKKPFTIIPGVEYGLEMEEVGEALNNQNDEEELRIIRNEKYLLDSFCCDTGYLSDEELNETPSTSKVVSKVKQQRRAANIKEKRKFEKLAEPQVLGPFWWAGKSGCKKEMKKWQGIVFSDAPIKTGFTTATPDDHAAECGPAGTDETLAQKLAPSNEKCPDATIKVNANLVITDSDMKEDYNSKYAIKYLVKFLAEKMGSVIQGQGDGVSRPLESSTPMIKKSSVKVTQVQCTFLTVRMVLFLHF